MVAALSSAAAELTPSTTASSPSPVAPSAPAATIGSCSKQCVEDDSLFDFLKSTVQKTHAAPAKRARAVSGAPSSAKRVASGGMLATGEAGGGSSSGAASAAAAEHEPSAAASLALAADYRPLADADDDYDAEE